MAVVDMDKVEGLVGEYDEVVYEKELSLSSVTTSDWVRIPAGIEYIALTLSVGGGGKGKVEYSTDRVSVINSGSPIVMEWPAGEVDVNTSDALRAVTAVRLNQTNAGTAKLTMRAQ